MLAPIDNLYRYTHDKITPILHGIWYAGEIEELPLDEIEETIRGEFQNLLELIIKSGSGNSIFYKALSDIGFLLWQHNKRADIILENTATPERREIARRQIVSFHLNTIAHFSILCHDAKELGIYLTEQQKESLQAEKSWEALKERFEPQKESLQADEQADKYRKGFNFDIYNFLNEGKTKNTPQEKAGLPPIEPTPKKAQMEHKDEGKTQDATDTQATTQEKAELPPFWKILTPGDEADKINARNAARIRKIMKRACEGGLFVVDNGKYKWTYKYGKKQLAYFCMQLWRGSPIPNTANENYADYGKMYNTYFCEDLKPSMAQIKNEHKKMLKPGRGELSKLLHAEEISTLFIF